ncbi:MAG: sodium:solute symporter [Candidatus Marinimicrobia bacterium]|jgi:SSS family solute:Na+ symporter|nr:sodium:solute symporter [Candidatus Neomarinimicrobiota bacterium]
MTGIDYSIVFVYLGVMIFIGFYMQKKAKAGIDSYFLGDRSMPWWALGSSGMSSNLDISGTMIIVAFVYAIGAKGLYIEIRGGVTLIMAFLMIFMGKWNRRSGVMTLAEWMKFRFGTDKEGKTARLITAIISIILTIAMITYFAIGGGKFLGNFLGIPNFLGLPSQFWAAAILITLSMIYTVAAGLYGVIWTDVFQGIFIFLAIAYIVVKALGIDLPEEFTVSMPMKNGGFATFPTTWSEWTNIIPKWKMNIDPNSSYSMYNLFGIAIMFYLFKTTIEGSGGTGNYMIQRYYAAKTDKEAGLLSLFWIFLLSFRWPFIAALAVIGISLGSQITDPEMVLPVVVGTLPIGIKGFLIAGLMAAAMSTFDSTVNAGAAYWVKDIYQQHINKNANHKQLMRQSHWSSIIIVVIGLILTLFIRNINEIWGWITMSIGAGLIIPQLIRWYWWRLNGYGYAIGMTAGATSAIIWKLTVPATVEEYYAFMFAAGISLIATIIGTKFTKPTDDKVLQNFYNVTRPFGFWKKFKNKLPEKSRNAIDKENRRDIIATFMAVPWQIILFLFMMNLVFKVWNQLLVLGILLVALSIGLYFKWFRHLSTEVKVETDKDTD